MDETDLAVMATSKDGAQIIVDRASASNMTPTVNKSRGSASPLNSQQTQSMAQLHQMR